MERLFEYSQQLVAETPMDFIRYPYHSINWNNRMIGLIGPRGVGKTTLVLQYVKNQLDQTKSVYITVEDFYFAEHKLIDFADAFVKAGGEYLLIDEIHKYVDWSKELKLMYDYYKDLKIVFTGSSILDIKKGSSDLSRRAIVYTMQGLSFREYLGLFHKLPIPVYSLNEILTHQVDIPNLKHPLVLFSEYLKDGYYPFSREDDFNIRLQQVVNQTLEYDIPIFSDMHISTGRKLKHLLAVVAQSAPFKPNMSKIAEIIGISRNNIADYLLFMEEAGMIAQLKIKDKGIRSLGKVDKVYLDNPNLIYNLAKENQNIGNVRETFFFNQTRVKQQVYSSTQSDFLINDVEFEIGGKNKTRKQLRDVGKGFVVKDHIERGYLKTIPLWHFGLMY